MPLVYDFLCQLCILLKLLATFFFSKVFKSKFKHGLQVLHKSENFVVVCKEFDILINSNKSEEVTVQTQLRNQFPELVNPKLGHQFNFIHRLDYATSGVLCIASHTKACRLASAAFEKRVVDKFYVAIVRGIISVDSFEIRLAIGNDCRPEFSSFRMATVQSPFVSSLREAATKVLVLERGLSHDFPATKVLLKPITGRRHQLRLHMNALGHTIVGDYTYSYRRDVIPRRMFLHALRIVIPTSSENIDVSTQDPFLESDIRNRWVPVCVVRQLNHSTMEEITKSEFAVISL